MRSTSSSASLERPGPAPPAVRPVRDDGIEARHRHAAGLHLLQERTGRCPRGWLPCRRGPLTRGGTKAAHFRKQTRRTYTERVSSAAMRACTLVVLVFSAAPRWILAQAPPPNLGAPRSSARARGVTAPMAKAARWAPASRCGYRCGPTRSWPPRSRGPPHEGHAGVSTRRRRAPPAGRVRSHAPAAPQRGAGTRQRRTRRTARSLGVRAQSLGGRHAGARRRRHAAAVSQGRFAPSPRDLAGGLADVSRRAARQPLLAGGSDQPHDRRAARACLDVHVARRLPAPGHADRGRRRHVRHRRERVLRARCRLRPAHLALHASAIERARRRRRGWHQSRRRGRRRPPLHGHRRCAG